MHELIKLENVHDVLGEIEEAFYDIPFENSEFQTRAFVVAAQQTPARAYRAIGLRMHSKIQAVKEYIYNQEKTKIDLEEKQWMLDQPDISSFEKRRIQLEINKIIDGEAWGKKLLNDAISELNVLYDEFRKLPHYTRAQFESEEYNHFNLRLHRQLSANGAQESLLNMTEDLHQMPKRIEQSVGKLKAPKMPTPGLPPKIAGLTIV